MISCGRGADLLVENADNGLCHGQVSGGQQDQNPFALRLPDIHFLERRDIVETGVCSGVRREHDPPIEHQSNTVGHGSLPIRG